MNNQRNEVNNKYGDSLFSDSMNFDAEMNGNLRYSNNIFYDSEKNGLSKFQNNSNFYQEVKYFSFLFH